MRGFLLPERSGGLLLFHQRRADVPGLTDLISTPSVTRSMQHLEEQFAAPLFVRGKNRIELNETGQVAVEAARKLLQAAEQTVEQVRAAWEDGSCDLAILPFPLDGAKPLLRENLFVCVPPEHELAKQKQLTFADINGFNFLLRSELGFWDALCREKMPSSKFLVQTDDAVFDELVKACSLPCFTTDYGQLQGGYPDRVNIPLTDDAAHITFYLLRR